MPKLQHESETSRFPEKKMCTTKIKVEIITFIDLTLLDSQLILFYRLFVFSFSFLYLLGLCWLDSEIVTVSKSKSKKLVK